jgi:N-acetylglucosamine kinase-like BadF-type ATPase
MRREIKEKYVIGVDGGGTKTVAALADSEGKILKLAKAGPSNFRNIGMKTAIKNITLALKKVLPEKGKVFSTFVGLAGVKEEYKFHKEKIKKEILKTKKISKALKGKIEIGSDQIVAFRSGTNKREGVVLIAGTGCAARGWKKEREAKTSGWGWLNDEGSGFWVGQKGFQAVLKDLDKRGPKTKITNLIFKKWKIKKKEDILKRVYSKNSVSEISLISKIVDEAAKRKDKIAISILTEAGKELALATNTVIKRLNFQKQKFPLVLVGSMFDSKFVLNTVKKEIKKTAPEVEFIRPKIEPVVGAVRLAIEKVKKWK